MEWYPSRVVGTGERVAGTNLDKPADQPTQVSGGEGWSLFTV
jgi:hypothetical protein